MPLPSLREMVFILILRSIDQNIAYLANTVKLQVVCLRWMLSTRLRLRNSHPCYATFPRNVIQAC